MPFLSLTPAYGRDYKKGADAVADYHANKDFVMSDLRGDLINKEQVPKGTSVTIRYGQLRKIVAVK